MNEFFPNDFTVVKHLNGYIALGPIRNKYAVFNVTVRSIRELPSNPFRRKLGRATRSINTNNLHHRGRTRCVIVIVSIKNRVIKFTRCLCIRNDNYAVNCSTFGSVGRNRTHRVRRFPFTLRNERRGTAAVTVNRVNTTKRKHHFAHFIVGKPRRGGCVTTVYLTKYKRTVRFNTDH